MNVLVSEAGMLHVAERSASRSATSVMIAASAGLILVAAPLAFGATSTLASLLLVAVSWLLLMAWLAERIHAGRVPIFNHPLAVPVALLLGFTAMHWAFRISVAPVATEFEWLRWVGYAALSAVAVSALDTPGGLRGVAAALAIAGGAVALLGVA